MSNDLGAMAQLAYAAGITSLDFAEEQITIQAPVQPGRQWCLLQMRTARVEPASPQGGIVTEPYCADNVFALNDPYPAQCPALLPTLSGRVHTDALGKPYRCELGRDHGGSIHAGGGATWAIDRSAGLEPA